jgi:2'-hydroxyisoflavone reductase
MQILVLGGTRFLGRHFVDQALAAGHELTLLHRGHSGAGLFPQAEHLIADRDGDLSVLDGRRWDAVLDTSAYLPRQVRAVADRLVGRIGVYQLVSTISVYPGFDRPGIDEDTPRAVLSDPEVQLVDGNTYGGLKALCEDAALAAFGERGLIARPGLLVGPHDPTERFTWWVRRVAAGGDVLAPGNPAAPVQFIDARDAAGWLLQAAAAGTRGVFNLTGPVRAPGDPLTMGEFLATAVEVLAPAARLHWLGERFLLDQDVVPWTELPVWVPSESAGIHQVDIRRAVGCGLQNRPLAATLADTAAWAAGVPAQAGTGLAAEREASLLAAWHASADGAVAAG